MIVERPAEGTMDQTERQVINDLFGKLQQAERQTGPREPEAEQHIKGLLTDQPAAPYYMAQAIVVQEQALKAAQARIEQLEGELKVRPAGGGGFLGGLFGAGATGGTQPGNVPPPPANPQLAQFSRQANTGRGPWGGGGGSSFLGGAMQTAMGVAGGLVLGNLLMGAFDSGEAMAADAAGDVAGDGSAHDPTMEEDAAFADEGDFGADDFGGGDI